MASFRIAVSGSRHLRDAAFVREKLAALLANRLPDVELLHGGADGADALADAWARETLALPPVVFPAVWEKRGKPAGPLRNEAMIAAADALLAFPLYPVSLGTQNAMGMAIGTRKPVVAYWIELDEAGMVRRVDTVASYNRKPLTKEVLG